MVNRQRWDVVPVLVHHGADVNLCSWAETPLYAAVKHTSDSPMDTVNLLMSPYNINMKARGWTTLQRLIWDSLEAPDLALLEALLEHGATCSVCEVIRGITHNYPVEHIKCLLQYLPMIPYQLKYVEFVYYSNTLALLDISDFGNMDIDKYRNINIPENPNTPVFCIVDTLCHLLQQTCAVKEQKYSTLYDEDLDDNIACYMNRTFSEFVAHEHFRVCGFDS